MDISSLYALFLKGSGIATDSRNVEKENLFFALKGHNFNGNHYALDALKKGASYAIIDEEAIQKNEQIIVVKDALKTLQDLAKFHRQALGTKIIALTGSNGKTTTKELFKNVLGMEYEVLATEGNLNNHIGVPLTLFQLKPTTEIGIIEMGANHKGEIKELSEMVAPDWGYITNFGKAHLEGFGSVQGIIEGKSELYSFLKRSKGSILYNADDPLQKELLESYSSKTSFGQDTSSNFVFEFMKQSSKKGFQLKCQDTTYASSLHGEYNLVNIAAAISIGKIFDVFDTDIQKGLTSYVPQNNRSQRIQKKGMEIVLDAYNANPTSMMAALKAFVKTKNKDHAVVILGDMLELGDYAQEEHQKVVDYCESVPLEGVILVGNHFKKTDTKSDKTLQFSSTEDLMNYLKENPLQAKRAFLKGSRGMTLEKIVSIF